VDQIVADFEHFIEGSTIQLRFQVQLINFQMAAPCIQLADGLVIRRLSEREVSGLQAIPMIQGTPHPGFIKEFILEGDLEVTKAVGGETASQINAQETINGKLDKVIVCLRTFKEGFVGYDWVHFKFP